MRLYWFSFIDDGDRFLTFEPFIEFPFLDDEAAKQEAFLTAGDLDHRPRPGRRKEWLRGELVVREGDREVIRVPVNRR